MPRTKNKTQSPYHMGLLAQLLVIAIKRNVDGTPTGKEQAAWFAKHLKEPGWRGPDERVPLVGSMIKVYRNICHYPTECSFAESTFDRVCEMLANDLDFVDFTDYAGFKSWAPAVPKGAEGMALAAKGKLKIKEIYAQAEDQRRFGKGVGGRALSLMYSIQSTETYLSIGELTAGETEEQLQKQKYQITCLEALVTNHPEQIVVESFVRTFNAAFFYNYHWLTTAELTPKLWPVAWKMDQYLKNRVRCNDGMLKLMLDLKNNLMKVAWGIGKIPELQQLNKELLELIEESVRRNTLQTTPLYPYYLDYFGYGCCFDSQRPVQFYHFAKEVDCPPKEKEVHIWRSLKCTACTKLRNKRYEEAEDTLNQMHRECSSIFQDLVSSKNLLAYYYYLAGSSQYHQGKHLQSIESLQRALDYWSNLELDESIEAGYAFYLLGEMERMAGHFVQSKQFAARAAAIFEQNTKTNACSFEYDQIKNLLVKNFSRNRT